MSNLKYTDEEKALTEWIYQTFGSRKEYGTREFRESARDTVAFSFYLVNYKFKRLGQGIKQAVQDSIFKGEDE